MDDYSAVHTEQTTEIMERNYHMQLIMVMVVVCVRACVRARVRAHYGDGGSGLMASLRTAYLQTKRSRFSTGNPAKITQSIDQSNFYSANTPAKPG